jgi:uncharacterized protein DUF6111
MLRVGFTIILPLILPTVLYLAWIWAMGWSQRSDATGWAALPWLPLAATGVVLLAVVLFVVTVGFGTSTPGVYVPPRLENGRIIPGHIEPSRRP